jgi:hypothetical protein
MRRFFILIASVAIGGLAWGVPTAGAVGPVTSAPSALGFGSLAIGAPTVTKQVTLTNADSVPLFLWPALQRDGVPIRTVPDPNYRIDGSDCTGLGHTIAPGASCTVSVTFDPKYTGAANDALVVTATNPSYQDAVFTFPITGRATSAIAPPGKPVVKLVNGLDNGGVPVQITWPASPLGGACYQPQWVNIGAGGWSDMPFPNPERRAIADRIWPGDDDPYGWRVRAYPCLQTFPWHFSTYVDAAYLSPSRIYDWPTHSGWTFYGNGDSAFSTRRGATLVGVCPGCYGIDLTVNRGPRYGSFKLYVDGRYVTTISTHANASDPSRIVWHRNWSSPGDHRIRLVNAGTAGHARVDVVEVPVLKPCQGEGVC